MLLFPPLRSFLDSGSSPGPERESPSELQDRHYRAMVEAARIGRAAGLAERDRLAREAAAFAAAGGVPPSVEVRVSRSPLVRSPAALQAAREAARFRLQMEDIEEWADSPSPGRFVDGAAAAARSRPGHCAFCGDAVPAGARRSRRYCSEVCRMRRGLRSQAERFALGDLRPPDVVEAQRALVRARRDKGDVAEAVVFRCLVGEGFDVRRPEPLVSRFGRFTLWDWSVFRGLEFCRVEVRCADSKFPHRPVGAAAVKAKWAAHKFDVLAVVGSDGSLRWYPDGGVRSWFEGSRFKWDLLSLRRRSAG